MASPAEDAPAADPRRTTFVMLTSTPAHTRYLAAALGSHARLGFPMGVGWDYYTFNYPKRIRDDIHVFCSQSFLGDQNGDAWQIQTGLTYALYNGYTHFLKSAATSSSTTRRTSPDCPNCSVRMATSSPGRLREWTRSSSSAR